MPREVIGSEQSGQRVAIIDTTNEFPSTKPIGFFQRLSFRRRNTEITPDDTTIYPDINRTWSILKKEYGEFKDFIVGYLSDEEGATASTSKFQVPLGTGGRRDKPTI
ncbi:MAG: hypothetical protein KKD39_02005, partial [Candidatus Altiarchaeota archaeon]|nr:hypothetical protein [Candidatus Altiarchaeota archaeon]